jgi:hypothetical protein
MKFAASFTINEIAVLNRLVHASGEQSSSTCLTRRAAQRLASTSAMWSVFNPLP